MGGTGGPGGGRSDRGGGGGHTPSSLKQLSLLKFAKILFFFNFVFVLKFVAKVWPFMLW